jgi:putative tricarboxylic transport membrane protein
MGVGEVLGGFAVATQPVNLLYTFVAVLLGTLVGALPGIGSTTTVAILALLAVGLDLTSARRMLQ